MCWRFCAASTAPSHPFWFSTSSGQLLPFGAVGAPSTIWHARITGPRPEPESADGILTISKGTLAFRREQEHEPAWQFPVPDLMATQRGPGRGKHADIELQLPTAGSSISSSARRRSGTTDHGRFMRLRRVTRRMCSSRSWPRMVPSVGDNEYMTVGPISELSVPYDAQTIELKVQRRRRRMRSQLVSLGITIVLLAGIYFWQRDQLQGAGFLVVYGVVLGIPLILFLVYLLGYRQSRGSWRPWAPARPFASECRASRSPECSLPGRRWRP